MTASRVPLAAAGIVAGVLLLQAIASTLISYGTAAITPGFDVRDLGFPIAAFVVNEGFRVVAFGLGVWFSLKFVAPIRTDERWVRVVGRGFIAAALGTAVVFVIGVTWAILAAVHVSSYPFGYSLDPSLDAASIPNNLLQVVNVTLSPLVNWFPLVVLVAVLERVWLRVHPEPGVPPSAAERESISA